MGDRFGAVKISCHWAISDSLQMFASYKKCTYELHPTKVFISQLLNYYVIQPPPSERIKDARTSKF